MSGIPLSPSNLRPFGAPPSIGRRERPREPLPLEGAAERSEAGLASFFAAKPPPLCLPHRGRGTAPAVDRVLSLTAYLRRSPPLVFHTARTLSGSLRSPPSPRGEGFVSGIPVLSFRSLPHWGRGTAQRRSGALVNGALETISFALFHTASTLSGSLRSPPSHRGEGFVRRCYDFM